MVRNPPLRGRLREAPEAARDRLRFLRLNIVLAVQAGLAAALAWLAAHTLLHVAEPVFAPITAVGTIVSSVGQRLRNSVELVVGVGVGIAAGDLLIGWTGTGPWQTALVVALAVAASLALQGGTSVAVQAGGTAVLVATLTPMNPHLELPRFLNAAVGGAIGIVVVTALLPTNPLRQVELAAEPLLLTLGDQLRRAARGLAERDADLIQSAMDRLQELEPDLDDLHGVLAGAREVTWLAPLRWHRRHTVARYQSGLKHMEHVVGTVIALIRRAATVVTDREPVPDQLPASLDGLADAVHELHSELHAKRPPRHARAVALDAVRTAGGAYATDIGFSGQVVVAMVRTAAHDLLQACGLDRDEANRMVREAAGRDVAGAPRPQPPHP